MAMAYLLARTKGFPEDLMNSLKEEPTKWGQNIRIKISTSLSGDVFPSLLMPESPDLKFHFLRAIATARYRMRAWSVNGLGESWSPRGNAKT